MQTEHDITCGCCDGPAKTKVGDDLDVSWRCPNCTLSGMIVPPDFRAEMIRRHKAAQPQ